MNIIHRPTRDWFVFFVTIALVISPCLASAKRRSAKPAKHASKNETRERAKTTRPMRGAKSNRPVREAKTNRVARGRIESRRRAEAARLAAIAHQHAAEDAMRARVQDMIAKDDTTGEDPEIRRIAVNALGNHAGTVVVMDPQTGRVYAIVNQQWAVREGFKPCSTIKLVTSLAGLNEEVIDPADTTAISSANKVSLTKALAYSKNDYFQQVGGQVGLDKMLTYARQVGLGSKTGINLRNESAGRIPGSKPRRGGNRVFSHGDGFKVTALQLAKMASVIANRGKVVVPFVSRTLTSPNSITRRQVQFNSITWQSMVPGMVGAVQYGSGRKAYDPTSTIAGKTGTCIENGGWVGLFTSYAPLKNPSLAIAVIARGSDGRNHFPAAVAGRIYRALSHRFGELDSQTTKAGEQPNESINAVAEEVESNNEEEASENNSQPLVKDEDRTPARQTIWGTELKSKDDKIKLTTMALPTPSVGPNIASKQTRPRRVSGGDRK